MVVHSALFASPLSALRLHHCNSVLVGKSDGGKLTHFLVMCRRELLDPQWDCTNLVIMALPPTRLLLLKLGSLLCRGHIKQHLVHANILEELCFFARVAVLPFLDLPT